MGDEQVFGANKWSTSKLWAGALDSDGDMEFSMLLDREDEVIALDAYLDQEDRRRLIAWLERYTP